MKALSVFRSCPVFFSLLFLPYRVCMLLSYYYLPTYLSTFTEIIIAVNIIIPTYINGGKRENINENIFFIFAPIRSIKRKK